MAEAGCLRDAKLQNLEVVGNTIMTGINTIKKIKVSENGDANLTVTEALHAGSVIMQTDVSDVRTYTLPTPSEGVIYRFLGQGSGTAADGHDVILQLGTVTHNFDGMITHHDTSNDNSGGALNVGVWANGSTHDKLQINIPAGYDITLIGKNATTFYITGTVTSDTAPAFSST